MSNYLETEIAKGSPASAVIAKKVGPAAARPVALAALRSPSPGARRAALECLGIVGQSADLGAVAALVGDASRPVAAAATLAVVTLHPGAVGQGSHVLAAFDATGEPELRRELARALGERPDVPLDAIKARRREEKDARVQEALGDALAKRGSRAEISRVGVALGKGKGREKKPAFERAAYVRRIELVPPLVALLDDETPIDTIFHATVVVRVCDEATRVLHGIVGGNIAAGRIPPYVDVKPEARDELRAWAESALKEAQ